MKSSPAETKSLAASGKKKSYEKLMAQLAEMEAKDKAKKEAKKK